MPTVLTFQKILSQRGRVLQEVCKFPARGRGHEYIWKEKQGSNGNHTKKPNHTPQGNYQVPGDDSRHQNELKGT